MVTPSTTSRVVCKCRLLLLQARERKGGVDRSENGRKWRCARASLLQTSRRLKCWFRVLQKMTHFTFRLGSFFGLGLITALS